MTIGHYLHELTSTIPLEQYSPAPSIAVEMITRNTGLTRIFCSLRGFPDWILGSLPIGRISIAYRRDRLGRTITAMARGWESKAVEEQQSEFAKPSMAGKPRRSAAELAQKQQQFGLQLSRKRVLQQLETAQNPRHRTLLETALADLEAKLGRSD
jgi:hypothetical protein